METTPLMLQRRVETVDSNGNRAGPERMRTQLAGHKPKPVVLIDDTGATSYTNLRKQALVSDLQLRHRDIRALDPGVALPYPSAIFIRKQALVINLEGLKLIIGREKVLVISVPRMDDLSARTLPQLDNPVVVRLSNHIASSTHPFGELGVDGMLPSASFMTVEEMKAMQSMPYELRALEAALLTVVKILEHEVAALEAGTHPVLARIRRGVVRSDLETLYDVQNRLAKTVARVGKIKEILEEFLDDDLQMAGMCLSRTDAMGRSESMGGGNTPCRGSSGDGGDIGEESGGGGKCEQVALDMDRDEVGEAEDLMEAYWLQVDSLLSRLQILQERIASTEHLVNLDLDSKRNALVALGLAVDLVLMCFETHMMLTGIFGMNLTSGLEPYQPYSLWAIVVVGLMLGCSLTLTIALYAKRKGLLFLPSFGLGPIGGPSGSGGGAATPGGVLGGG